MTPTQSRRIRVAEAVLAQELAFAEVERAPFQRFVGRLLVVADVWTTPHHHLMHMQGMAQPVSCVYRWRKRLEQLRKAAGLPVEKRTPEALFGLVEMA